MSATNPRAPAAVPDAAQEIVRRHMTTLDPADLATMNTANIVLLRHATLGLLLGASAGVAWSMRAKRVGGGVSSLFYPTRAGGQVVAGKAVPEKPVEDVLALRARAIAKGMGFGIMGAISGVQVGVWTGSMAGKRTIAKRPGCEIRVAQVMNAATQELKEAGLLDARFSVPGLTAAANAIQPNARETTGSSEFEPTKEFYANEVPDEGLQFMERKEEQGATSAALEGERSRWDELRKSKAAPPSSWDILREKDAKAAMASRASQATEQSALSGPRDGSFTTSDKEKERRDFERMMDQERKGGADAGGSRYGDR